MKSCLVAFIALFLPLAMSAQETRSTISGAVTDSSGAAIPNVKVTTTETRTGTKASTVSDAAGQYTIPVLSPGLYELSALEQGFKKFVRSGLEIGSGDHPVIDIK